MNYLQKVKSERDELKAELERVKAERDSALESADIQCNIRYMQTEELESIKSRLPVNADGDVVLWGDEQFYIDSTDDSVVNSFTVEEIARDGNRFGLLSIDEIFHLPKDCHSSAESCRAAHEKGEATDGK